MSNNLKHFRMPNLQKKCFQERVKQIISDPIFDKPIADLNKDLSKKGVLTLVTKIKIYS